MGWLDDVNSDAKQQQVDEQRRTVEVKRSTAKPSEAKLVSDLRKQYPWLTPGAAVSLAKAGYAADSKQAREVARRAADRKKKKGFGWHSIGDVVGSVGDWVMPEKAEDVIGTAIRGTPRVGKAAVRGAFTVLDSGQELAASTVRRTAGNVLPTSVPRGARTSQSTGLERKETGLNPIGGTKLGIIAEKVLSGDADEIDLGSGFFPGGKIAERQAEVARQELSLPGPKGTRQAATPGRLLAYTVAEPGTTAYNWTSGIVDAAFVLKTDAGIGALSKVGRINQARKLVDPSVAGGIRNATRRTALPELATAYLQGKDGRKFLDWAAGETSPKKIFDAMGGKVGADEAADLASLATADEVAQYVLPKLGTSIREKPYVANSLTRGAKPVDGFSSYVPESITKRLDGVRMTHIMPGRHVDPNDPTDVAKNMARFAYNAKLGPEKAEEYFNMASRARGPIGQFNVVKTILADASQQMMAKGTGERVSRQMTTMFTNYMQDAAKYYTDDIGMNAPVLGAVVRGDQFALPTPHLYTEYINRAIPLPDPRAVRRATSTYGRVLNRATLDGARRPIPVALLDFAFQDVWKPLVLLRGAWTVRVVGEEQIRMGAVGLNSVVSNPLQAIAWAVGRKGGTDLAGKTFDAADDVTKFSQALTHRGEQWRDRVQMMGQVTVQRGSKGYADALSDELAKLRNDPITQRLARGLGPDDGVATQTGNPLVDVKEWFWSGAGQKFRKDMAEAQGREMLATSRDVADELIDSMWRRIETKTAGKPELLEVIATGKFNGVDAFVKAKKGMRQSDEFAAHIDDFALRGEGPSTAVGKLERRMSNGVVDDTGINRAVDSLFNTLMSRPTNYLSRSPAFRQFYWRNAEELMNGMTVEAQRVAVSRARKANLDRNVIARMEKQVGRVTGDLTAADVDTLAKAYSLDETRKLLYDLTERSQFFDISRHFFPFGEAWAEVLKVWGSIIANNPQAIRRAQLGIKGARGSGFFHPDENGEEVFHYPGTGFMTREYAGVPAPFVGRVQGLNVFSENPLMPGFGPMVQMSASAFLPKKSSWDTVRKMVSPFGDPDTSGGILEAYLPAWAQKFRQAGDTPFGRQDDRIWMNTVMESARYLRNENPEWDDEKLSDEATKAANRLYRLRGMAQFVAPSAPSPSFQAKDKDGRLMTAFKLVEKFRDLEKADRKNGTDTAVETFLTTYGPDALLYMQDKTEGGGPVSTEALKWVTDNKAFVKKYPLSYALFAPQGEGFNYDAYVRLLKNGEVRPLSQNEFLANANNRVAAMIYRQAQKAVGEKRSDKENEWLRGVKAELRVQYPGYDTLQPREKRITERQIEELGKAVKERAVADTPLARGIATYLEARSSALAEAKRRGLASFSTAKKAANLRAWLRRGAEDLAVEFEGFEEVFDRVFSRELDEESEG